jgi:hypothetical protein
MTMVSQSQRGCLIVLLLTVLGLSTQASGMATLPDCQKAAISFLNRPTQHTFATLVGGDDARCWPIIGSSNSNLQQLTGSVEKGNQWASRYLSTNLRNMDGGNLEDSLIALGRFADHKMERLLILAHAGKLSKQELVESLTMLPLSLSDDLPAQLTALKARRALVMRVNQDDLADQKTAALKAIDDFISQINAATPPPALPISRR